MTHKGYQWMEVRYATRGVLVRLAKVAGLRALNQGLAEWAERAPGLRYTVIPVLVHRFAGGVEHGVHVRCLVKSPAGQGQVFACMSLCSYHRLPVQRLPKVQVLCA